MLTSLWHAYAQNFSRLQRQIHSFPRTRQKVGILLFAVTVFPTGSVSEEEESFTLLFLLRIGNSYHRRNSIGNNKSYLGFFKEYEGRTGRRKRGLKEIWDNFTNGVVVQRRAVQALPMLKCCCEGGWARHRRCKRTMWEVETRGVCKYSSNCPGTEEKYRWKQLWKQSASTEMREVFVKKTSKAVMKNIWGSRNILESTKVVKNNSGLCYSCNHTVGEYPGISLTAVQTIFLLFFFLSENE